MVQSGLTQKWFEEFFLVDRNQRKYVEEVDPQVLDVETLRLGFFAYLIFLMLSVVIFVLERLSVTLNHLKSKFHVAK